MLEGPRCIVCRCEDVVAQDIADAIDAGAGTAQEVKFRTRAGMGFCQGRVCRSAVEAMLAHRGIEPDPEDGHMTVRLPVRPTALEDLADGDEAE